MVVTAVPRGVVQQVVLTRELSEVTERGAAAIGITPQLGAVTHRRLQVVATASELLEDVRAALDILHRRERGGGVGGVHVAVIGGVGQSVRLNLP